MVSAIFTGIGTYAGVKFVNKLVERTGKQSYIVLGLAILIFMSMVIMPFGVQERRIGMRRTNRPTL